MNYQQKSYYTVFVFIIVMVIIGIGTCQALESQRQVTDLAGRRVVVPLRIDRIVALGPGTLRLVTYLQAVDKVVGIEQVEQRNTAFFLRPYAAVIAGRFKTLPVVAPGGAGKLPDMEQLMACRPQLILCIGLDVAQVENLQQKTRIPVLFLSYGELGVLRQEAIESIRLLGNVLGKEERAARLIDFIGSVRRDLRQRVQFLPGGVRSTVYFGGIAYKGGQGLTSTEAGYFPGRLVQARNVADFSRRSGHLFIDPEQLMLWNPDMIFIDASSLPMIMDDFQHNRVFYRLLKAVKSGKVFSLLPYNQYNTNIEIALVNAYFIGRQIFPDVFADFDMVEKRRQIFRLFLGNPGPEQLPAYSSLSLADARLAQK
jgi:iron complex transport system substrate-binding protein